VVVLLCLLCVVTVLIPPYYCPSQESIDDSAALRYEKAPGLLTSLHSKLPDRLTDQALLHGQMRRKAHGVENQEYLLSKYKELGTKNFHSNYDPTKFLSHIYGRDSNIVKYKTFVLQRNEQDYTTSLYDHSHSSVYDPNRFDPSYSAYGEEMAPKSAIEVAEDAYWNNAQKVLVDTKSWVELQSSMTQYYKVDRAKKIRAAQVLQKWIRRFLMSSFNFERKMKHIDTTARTKLQEKVRGLCCPVCCVVLCCDVLCCTVWVLALLCIVAHWCPPPLQSPPPCAGK
jgi:hypothetical protein